MVLIVRRNYQRPLEHDHSTETSLHQYTPRLISVLVTSTKLEMGSCISSPDAHDRETHTNACNRRHDSELQRVRTNSSQQELYPLRPRGNATARRQNTGGGGGFGVVGGVGGGKQGGDSEEGNLGRLFERSTALTW